MAVMFEGLSSLFLLRATLKIPALWLNRWYWPLLSVLGRKNELLRSWLTEF